MLLSFILQKIKSFSISISYVVIANLFYYLQFFVVYYQISTNQNIQCITWHKSIMIYDKDLFKLSLNFPYCFPYMLGSE